MTAQLRQSTTVNTVVKEMRNSIIGTKALWEETNGWSETAHHSAPCVQALPWKPVRMPRNVPFVRKKKGSSAVFRYVDH